MVNKTNKMSNGTKKLLFSIVALTVFITGCTVSSGNQAPVVAGVFKSINKGESWFARNTFLDSSGVGSIAKVDVLNMTFDPSDDKAIYLATANAGLLFSYDTADSWFKAAALGEGKIRFVAIDPSDKCTIYATKSNTIMKSTDCSRNWVEIFIDAKVENKLTAVAVDSFNSKNIYVGNSIGDIFKSEDGGNNWRVVHRTRDVIKKLLINPNDTRIIYAATNRRGIFKTNDAGASWADVNDDMKKYSGALEYKQIIFDPSQVDSLLYVAKYGLLKTDDGGVTWNPITLITPPASTDILAVAINPDDNQEIFYTTRSTFYKTSDGGENWITKRLPSRAVPTYLILDPSDSAILYLGMRQLKK